jgi:hypothetical protein
MHEARYNFAGLKPAVESTMDIDLALARLTVQEL